MGAKVHMYTTVTRFWQYKNGGMALNGVSKEGKEVTACTDVHIEIPIEDIDKIYRREVGDIVYREYVVKALPRPKIPWWKVPYVKFKDWKRKRYLRKVGATWE